MRTDSPNLNLLRSIAVAFVVVSHLRYFLPGWTAYESHYSLETLGRTGVAIFFVHTTLVLLMSLQRTHDSAAAFLVRRAFRIYPLACAVVLFTAMPGMLGLAPLNVAQLASNLLLVQNITGHASSPQPLWSLPYEMQMYFALPLVFLLARGHGGRVRVAAMCVVATGAAFAAVAAGHEFRVLRFVPCFLPGALAFAFWRPLVGPWALFGVVGVAAVVIPALVPAGWSEMACFWVLCPVLSAAIASSREVRSEWLASAGKIVATYSYGIYLTHIMALGLAFSAGRTGPLQWAICAVMLPVLAWVAYHAVERPGIALGRRAAAALMGRGSGRRDRLPAATQSSATARP
jgi:peptidoglycan/LPS O-acetylase OafA/YrhL